MKTGLIYIAVGLVLGFLVKAYLFTPQPIIEIVEVEAEPIVIERVIAQIDTVYVRARPQRAKIDTVYLPQVVVGDDWIIEAEPGEGLVENTIAVGDTMFEDFGKLDVIYYFPPLNFFDFTFDPEPVTITTIRYKPKWYERKEFAFISGVVFTGLAVYLVK